MVVCSDTACQHTGPVRERIGRCPVCGRKAALEHPLGFISGPVREDAGREREEAGPRREAVRAMLNTAYERGAKHGYRYTPRERHDFFGDLLNALYAPSLDQGDEP